MPNPIELWGVKDPNISAQLALACQLDLFKREAGLDVHCQFITSGTTMAEHVLQHAQHPPFAFTQTPITALLLRERGIPCCIIAPLADITGAQQVIVRESSGISSPEDLKGKHVGMAQGAAIYLALKNMAKDCNVNLADVRFVDLLPQDQIEAFKAGKLDVIASWEPWTTKALTLGGIFYFSGTESKIPGVEGAINWLINQSCLIVPEEHLPDHRNTVIAILNVLRKTTNLLNYHRTEVTDILARFFDFSRAELLLAMQKNTYSLAVSNLFRLGILGFRDFLYDTGQITSLFPEEGLYDVSFLREVDRSLVFLEDTVSEERQILEEDGIFYRDDFVLRTNGASLEFLLADDSRFVRAALAKAVGRIGGQVVGEAATGSEAIEKVAHLHSDVITMDLSMPGVSGLEAIKIILQIEPQMNIIVISGTDLKEVRQEIFNLGVKMFVTKPFQPEQVANILAQRIRRVA